MAVTKRTRFEVLKRDNYTCRYCRSADGELTIDHVVPVALGGTDRPDNLVAACKDCNAGKSSSAPDAELVDDVKHDAERWTSALKSAGQEMLNERPGSALSRNRWFLEAWHEWDADYTELPDGWSESVDKWIDSGLPAEVLLDCLNIALAKRQVPHASVFAYMGGIARNKIADLQARAAELLAEED